MYRLSKVASGAIYGLIAVGIALTLLLGSPHGKLILNWFGNASVERTPLGYNFSTEQKFERGIIYLPTIHNNKLEKAIHLLALNIYHEARGENIEGMIAVGFVTLNRVRSGRFPNSVADVVQQGGEKRNRCQFSWWCDGRRDTPKEGKAWQQARLVAKGLLKGKYFDETEGALFYYNPKKSSPCWGESSSFIVNIGSHKFFGDIPWSEMKLLCRFT